MISEERPQTMLLTNGVATTQRNFLQVLEDRRQCQGLWLEKRFLAILRVLFSNLSG